jgi:5-methylcytosine-specific restriction endonuclease McrA
VRRVSRKRAAAMRVYRKRAAEFLTEHPQCAICRQRATEVHHMAGRIGPRLLDESRWMALCRDCNRFVTEQPALAIEMGWSLPRVGGAA